jgi:hypothetical protein
MEGCELDLSGMGQGLVEGVYEHGKEIFLFAVILCILILSKSFNFY